ncbi:MAG: NlpC/P60 family protein [Micromonosporaceae bacterium]
MGAHPARSAFRLRQGVITVTSVALAGAFIAFGGAAGAAPSPTPSELRHKISKLMTQLDAVSQQYDQSLSNLRAAKATLARTNHELAKDEQKFEAMRAAIAQIASAAYEQGGLNSASTLLTTNNPQTVLDQAAMLSHLTSNRRAQMTAFLSAARALRDSQQKQARTKAAIAQLNKNKAAQKHRLQQLVAKNRSELAKLTAPASGTVSGGPTTPVAGAGAARVAVAFALAQIGKPYVWGGTGPNGYDCSGLVQAAWAAAGVSIPRTTYDQWASLPHVSSSDIQPGDLLLYDAEGHVSIYVGNGMIVDAPQQGENVEEIPQSSSWYASNFDGAVRP